MSPAPKVPLAICAICGAPIDTADQGKRLSSGKWIHKFHLETD